jgi:hypothetical protein
MGRLGDWQPDALDERIDRLESLASIRQLAYRYALALDSRDMTALVGLFPPDVKVGAGLGGSDALRRWFIEIMSGPRTSVHFVGNHVIDMVDADHARGVVYCRDQLERPDSGRWDIGDLQYWDTYVRLEGEWFFERRKFHRWYMTDALTRPQVGLGVNDGTDPLRARQLPDAFESWHKFWAEEATKPAIGRE